MRCQAVALLCRIVGACALLVSTSVLAGWQVSTPQSSMPREPFFQAASPKANVYSGAKAPTYTPYNTDSFPNQYARLGPTAPVYAVSISGSLKENIERIMHRYHWKVVWKAPYDYNYDGRVTGSSLPNVIEKLLQPFPLQAVMYMSNRTVAIVPRQKT